jgi:soluble lytic murein transglycosylase-like protein
VFRSVPRFVLWFAVTVAAFGAGIVMRGRLAEPSSLLSPGSGSAGRIAALRTRLGAVERENENLRTEMSVRQALLRLDRGLGREETERIVASVLEAHHRYGLPADVLVAVINAESGFDPLAVSAAGAVGLMQLMPGTAKEVARDLDIPWTGDQILYDPVMNIRLGSAYLHRMFERFEQADTALAAYNAGPARVVDFAGMGVQPQEYPGRVRRGLEQVNAP